MELRAVKCATAGSAVKAAFSLARAALRVVSVAMRGCYHAAGTIANPRPTAAPPGKSILVELVRSNDLVHLSWAQAMLAAEGIECVLADGHVSAIEGSIGAIPRRLLVAAEDRLPAPSACWPRRCAP